MAEHALVKMLELTKARFMSRSYTQIGNVNGLHNTNEPFATLF